MSDEEIMSEEAFKELIDNLEIIEKLTPYGRKAIKYWVNKLQKENEEKDKIIYEIARSNVKLKGYEIEEKYIDTTIRFFTKYVKNLERNPQWRNDKNE